jgi:hypothetical protein
LGEECANKAFHVQTPNNLTLDEIWQTHQTMKSQKKPSNTNRNHKTSNATKLAFHAKRP